MAVKDESSSAQDSDDMESSAISSEEALRESAEKAEETHKSLVEAQDDHRTKAGIPLNGERIGLQELDLRCLELREGTRVVISELKAVASMHPELATLLASYGVKLPGTQTAAGEV